MHSYGGQYFGHDAALFLHFHVSSSHQSNFLFSFALCCQIGLFVRLCGGKSDNVFSIFLRGLTLRSFLRVLTIEIVSDDHGTVTLHCIIVLALFFTCCSLSPLLSVIDMACITGHSLRKMRYFVLKIIWLWVLDVM